MTFEQYDAARPLPQSLLEGALTLLEQAFPADERRERAQQRALIRSGRLTVLLAQDEQGSPAALMTLWTLGCGLFLEHFAVSEGLRGQGLGGRMLEELKRQLGGRRLVLESEPPTTDWGVRRLGFYERHGLRVYDAPYVQPPYRPGDRELPFCLLSLPAFSSREEFDRAAEEIHRTVYKVMR